ncbi:lipoprotein signal peptidase [Ferruginibacter lapsinanis]|uniref:lipoprotein signal peptidase n=1 Tax=Ferruginibacter lapsinanis TaxID=563172 RepID=UPI001E4C0FFE|nr:lipoprotein signal peptidase [Ferruginibacter lapsinanis]UEG51197.1 lipoprotein signal peptidase [Ferruginibacter lapsinanis]
MKGRNLAFIILFIVLADQALKIYIKTHYVINEQHNLLGNWSRLLFVENEGMAYGMSFGGEFGKILLTLFRFGAVIFGVWYLRNIIQKKYHSGFIICAGLIFAGALGNLIDSMFYGLIFEESTPMNVARIFPKHGYAGFLHGKVVDMLYFPLIRDAHFPDWFPVWGGEEFEFFRPIFNLADAAISGGVIAILLFQKSFFKHHDNHDQPVTVETNAVVNDDVQVQ